eukprot:85719-Pyramimonas_sp.AAC.1
MGLRQYSLPPAKMSTFVSQGCLATAGGRVVECSGNKKRQPSGRSKAPSCVPIHEAECRPE